MKEVIRNWNTANQARMANTEKEIAKSYEPISTRALLTTSELYLNDIALRLETMYDNDERE